MSKATRGTAAAPDDYIQLVRQFPLRPLRGVKDYDAAAAALDELAGRTDLTTGQRDYLDALTVFVEAYDRAHHTPQRAEATPLELLKAMMEHRAMTTTALGEVVGSKGVASEILNGKRALSKSQVFKLG